MDKEEPRQEIIGLDKISVEMDATVTEAVQTPESRLDMPRTAAGDKNNAETKPGGTWNSKKIYIVGVAFVLLGATIAACVVGFLRFVPRATILTDNGIPWVYSKGDPGGSRPSEIMIVDAWAPWGPMFSNFSVEFNSSKARNVTAAEMTVAADYEVPHWSYGENQQRYNPPSNQGTNLYDYLCRNGGCDEDDKDPSESSEEERAPSPPKDDSSDSSEEDPSPPPPEDDSSDSSEEENPPPPPEDDSSDSSDEEEHLPPHPEEDSSDSSEEEDPSPPPEDNSSDSSEEEHPPPRQEDPNLSDGHSASSESAHEASDGNSSGDASSDDHDTDVSFTDYHNMNCAHGIDNFYKTIEGTTHEACAEKCSSNSLCSAYSYYTDTRTCKLRQNCSNMRSQHGVATGVKDRSPDDGDNTNYKYARQTMCGDPSFLSFTADVSISKCQNKCTEDNRCGAYTYNLATNVCSLKKTCHLPRENVVHFSGIKRPSQPPPPSKPYLPSKPSPPKYDNKAAQPGQNPPPSAPSTAPKPASPSSQGQQESPPPKQESPPPTPRQPPTPPPQPQWKPPAQSPPEPPGPQSPASPQMTWKKPFEEPAPTTAFIPSNKRACTASGCPDTNGWMEAHNSRRSKYHVEFGKSYVPLRWSSGLASLAKMYATELVENGCELEHCTDRRGSYTECPFGENLAFQRSGVWNGDSVLERWVEDEILFLGVDYRGGHATQALWRATNYLGCGHAEGECGMVQVCRYVRPGNCDAYSNWAADTTGCGPDCPPEGCSNAAVAPFST